MIYLRIIIFAIIVIAFLWWIFRVVLPMFNFGKSKSKQLPKDWDESIDSLSEALRATEEQAEQELNNLNKDKT